MLSPISFYFVQLAVLTFVENIEIHLAQAFVRNAYGQLLLHDVCLSHSGYFDKQKSVTKRKRRNSKTDSEMTLKIKFLTVFA